MGDDQICDGLSELAVNLRWTWHRTNEELWGQLDPELWEATQNPWIVLQTVSRDRLKSACADAAFRQRTEELLKEQREAVQAPGWFQKTHPSSRLGLVAYFSMEYMLSEALPIYSGGLGNVAGDQLKAASNLGVPLVAIGLLYQQGYFRQEIDSNGAQHALYPYNAPGQLPITPLREQNGEWLRLPVSLPGFKLWLRTWQVEVGRNKLYLLDTNDPANPPAYRGITSELYGGGPELRIKQEMILGIAGWRLLRALGLRPEVCHLNEGHAAFAILERARAYMADNKRSFDVALQVTRAGNLFTTHTAVDAGFDRYSPDIIATYVGAYAERRLGISLPELLALGRQDPNDSAEPFNMAYLALHGSARVNGVSRLHGAVSRRLFSGLFPRWPEPEVPVGHVTNGVHVATWESVEADALWTRTCGADWWSQDTSTVEQRLRQVSDSAIWQVRTEGSRRFVHYVRTRLARERAAQGASAQDVAAAGHIFDYDTLTLGFARRFATYKRPNLLLHDPERLARILTNRERPVQLVLAGKAHPADGSGQAMIQQWNEFIRRPDVRPHAAFLADYDMLMTQQMVQGVDLWINTPRRPWEASGTSGMKVLANGGLNCSELDGWWAEAYSPEVGWAVGDGREHGDDPRVDAGEAAQLYDLLEREIIPKFYRRNEEGVPTEWVAMMRESMACLTPVFSAGRVVREYTDHYYLPAAQAYCQRAADQGKVGAELLEWHRAISAHWAQVRFGPLHVETRDGAHFFDLQVYLDDLRPHAVHVELYADPLDGAEPERRVMERGRALSGSPGGHTYSAQVPAARPAEHYTPRIVPFEPRAFVPLEANQILWQR